MQFDFGPRADRKKNRYSFCALLVAAPFFYHTLIVDDVTRSNTWPHANIGGSEIIVRGRKMLMTLILDSIGADAAGAPPTRNANKILDIQPPIVIIMGDACICAATSYRNCAPNASISGNHGDAFVPKSISHTLRAPAPQILPNIMKLYIIVITRNIINLTILPLSFSMLSTSLMLLLPLPPLRHYSFAHSYVRITSFFITRSRLTLR